MAVSYLAISAVSTALSFIGLQVWAEFSLDKLQNDGLISENFIHTENVDRALELLLGSYTSLALLANFVLNVFILLILSLKTVFFGELYPLETRKLVERLINYVIYKGTFLPLVIPPTVFQAGLWSIWLIVICCLKMFQALARDRFERLNASPSATPWAYFRVFSVFLFALSFNLLWISLSFMLYKTVNSSMFLLLFFEPLSIAFETMQAILVHGFQLLEILLHSMGNNADCQRAKHLDLSAAGSFWEWKGILIRNLGFFLDMTTLLMALGHYVLIWWLHGMAFHLVDAVLFLNIRALLSAIVKRIKGFIKLRMAFGALHGALPDATSEEIRAYDDECAICREPMAKAKKLHCNHLFHLACLRSWLDQGLNEVYSCPTCRKPLLLGRRENEANSRTAEALSDEQLARQISSGLNRPNMPGHTLPAGVFPNQMQNAEGVPWRGAGLDSEWLHSWPNQNVDGAGPSTDTRSVGLERVHMMMRHLASVGETYAQTALEDTAWSLWPMNPSQAAASVPPNAGGRYPTNTGNLHIRTAARTANDGVANILAMAETVREVLPHVPDELIFQDLQRTNSWAKVLELKAMVVPSYKCTWGLFLPFLPGGEAAGDGRVWIHSMVAVCPPLDLARLAIDTGEDDPLPTDNEHPEPSTLNTNSFRSLPSHFLVGSTMGLSVGFDTPMVTTTEDVPIENVEGSKRPRVQTSPPGFSGSSDLHGALVQLSAGLVNKVSDLIDESTNTWKASLIQSIFRPDQAEKILCIPLPSHVQHDSLFWRYDQSGIYSVKSGYRCLTDSSFSPCTTIAPIRLPSQRLYLSLWSLDLPAKIKIACWRFCNNYIPTAINLINRRVNVSPLCTLCTNEPETVEHIIKECTFSKQVFSVLHLDFSLVSAENRWLQWLSHLFEQFSESERILFVLTIWALWFYRNRKLHENYNQSPKDLAGFVQGYLMDIKASYELHDLQSGHPIAHWQSPPVGTVKTNFDAGFNSSNKSSVSGIIIRDSEGLVLASSTYPNNFISDPEVAEACACEQAVALTAELGFRRAIIEGDAISVISKMKSTKSDRSHISPIVHNVQYLKTGFVSLTFNFVRRSLNSVAHSLAQLDWSFPMRMVWIEEAPHEVDALLSSDRWWVDPPD
ncbi:hypothetical protein V6N11_057499 [Hibiscus sabdariffa]|uniref:RING-type domain-containing protein n=1 Tax=Hibiscus sabdariffa TaxID=183260 RepID=A0ABR2NHD9_9ROSI